jgi:hypothetical protein
MFLTVDQSGIQTSINLNFVVSFRKEGPTNYGTEQFLVSMANGELLQLNKEDSERFMHIFVHNCHKGFRPVNENFMEEARKILQSEHND